MVCPAQGPGPSSGSLPTRQPQLTQAPLPGHLAGNRLGLPSIFRYKAVSVLRCAACFFTSFESSAWIVWERWATFGLRACSNNSQGDLPSLVLCLSVALGHFGAGTTGTRGFRLPLSVQQQIGGCHLHPSRETVDGGKHKVARRGRF